MRFPDLLTGLLLHLSFAALPAAGGQLAEWQVAAAYAVFAASYAVFALGKLPGMKPLGVKIDRPGAAIIGAVLMVAFGVVTADEALRFVDFGTLVLLFSMMLVVGCLHLAGFFEWVAALTVQRLPPRRLLPAIVFLTGALSAFFVNDIICLAMVPFTLTATRRMGLKPLPYLVAVATASNIGSVATLTGNPQNILIGSYSGISYRAFLGHLGPVAAIGLVVDWLAIRWIFRREIGPHGETGGDETGGERGIAAQPLQGVPQGLKPLGLSAHHGTAEAVPFQGRIHAQSSEAGNGADGCGPENGAHSPGPASQLPPVDARALRRAAIVAALVLIGFLAGVPPAMMAAIGAALMLFTWPGNPRLVYDEVDWGVLVFFVGLFLIVGGAENAGLTRYLSDCAQRLNLQNAGVLTAVTAALSNVVSNVPAVMLLKPLVAGFRDARGGWLMLAMASTLAGNLTITGSVANLIVVERAKGEVQIGFWDYSRVGIPVTLVTLAVGWAWLTWVR